MSRFSKKQAELLKRKAEEGNKAKMSVKDRKKRKNKTTVKRRADINLQEAVETYIEIDQVIPGLNGGDGLMRENHYKQGERKKKMCDLISVLTRNKHIGPVSITFTRYTVELMDWDNMSASFKNVGDALVYARVIEDDKPDIIQKFNVKQVKVATYKEQKSTVFIKSIKDAKEKESSSGSERGEI